MAILIDAATNYMEITSGLFDYNAAYTFLLWLYPTDHSLVQCIAAIDNTNHANTDVLQLQGDGTIRIDCQANGGGWGQTQQPAISLNTWHFVGMRRHNVALMNLLLDGVAYGNAVGVNISGRVAATRFRVGNPPWSTANYVRGTIGAAKLWTAQLSDAEVAREALTIRPHRTADLWGWWPVFPGSGERARDYAGSGRNFTENGTLTDAQSPPISWGV